MIHGPSCGFHLHMSLDECTCPFPPNNWSVAHKAITALRSISNDAERQHSERVVAMCAIRDIERAMEHITKLGITDDAQRPA